MSPWPRRTAEAVTAFAEENLHQGALRYDQWVHTESELKQQLAQLINAPAADHIALLKNTSEGLSFVANGIAWRRGDRIVLQRRGIPV